MTDFMLKLKNHADAGSGDMKRLRYAKTREDAGKYVRILRNWHRDLRPIAEACGITLGAGDSYYPTVRESLPLVPVAIRPRVVNRHGEIPEAQRIMLAVTLAALSRLAPHLANAKPMPPKDKGGRRPLDPKTRIDAIQAELYEQKRRRETRNQEKAIRTVLLADGFEEGGGDYEKAFARLKKRKWL